MLKNLNFFTKIPEEDEAFTIEISDATDGALMGTPTMTTLTIYKNDDAIYFKGKCLLTKLGIRFCFWTIEHYFRLKKGTDLTDYSYKICYIFIFLNGNNKCIFPEPSHPFISEPGNITLVVIRDGPVDKTCTVKYKTVDGAAKAAELDYIPIPETLMVFQPGQREASFNVTALDDDLPEPNEAFYVDLYNVSCTYSIHFTTSSD